MRLRSIEDFCKPVAHGFSHLICDEYERALAPLENPRDATHNVADNRIHLNRLASGGQLHLNLVTLRLIHHIRILNRPCRPSRVLPHYGDIKANRHATRRNELEPLNHTEVFAQRIPSTQRINDPLVVRRQRNLPFELQTHRIRIHIHRVRTRNRLLEHRHERLVRNPVVPEICLNRTQTLQRQSDIVRQTDIHFIECRHLPHAQAPEILNHILPCR